MARRERSAATSAPAGLSSAIAFEPTDGEVTALLDATGRIVGVEEAFAAACDAAPADLVGCEAGAIFRRLGASPGRMLLRRWLDGTEPIPLLAAGEGAAIRLRAHRLHHGREESGHIALTLLAAPPSAAAVIRSLLAPHGGRGAVLLLGIEDAASIAEIGGAEERRQAETALRQQAEAALPRGTVLLDQPGGTLLAVLGGIGRDAAIRAAKAALPALTVRLDGVAEACAALPRLALAVTERRIAPEKLLSNARIAYDFDRGPRGAGLRIFDDAMRTALEHRARTRSELVAALDTDQIEPFFQPQIRFADGAVIGFEVLVRWRHPRDGVVTPSEFLKVAEESGLLPQIDDLMMRKAIAALAELRSLGHGSPRISLNCTGEALRDPNFVDRLQFELDRHGLGPADLAIEILETVCIDGSDDAAFVTLYALKRAGFTVEIDDFGRGQASILHLVTLRADVIKLDRSLIRGICTSHISRTVVEATVALADRLGIEALAEGAETAEQISCLESMGCHAVQGFGIARPMPQADLAGWLTTWQDRSVVSVHEAGAA